MDQSDYDPLLATFVRLVNDATIERVNISLLVGGTWLAGELVHGREWLQHIGVKFSDAGLPEVGGLFTGYAQDQDGPEERVKPSPLTHLHLKPTRKRAADTSASTAGYVLRVRVGAVQGWALGRLG